MKKLLGRVSLRNDHAVYEDGDSYVFAGENRRGQRYECRGSQEAVSYLRNRKGRHVIAEQAGDLLEPVAERFKLPYTCSAKLRYSGQYAPIVAVTLGHATVAKEGRSYVYSVR